MKIGRMLIECWIIKTKENKSTSVEIEHLSKRILYKGPNKCNLSLNLMKETFSCHTKTMGNFIRKHVYQEIVYFIFNRVK